MLARSILAAHALLLVALLIALAAAGSLDEPASAVALAGVAAAGLVSAALVLVGLRPIGRFVEAARGLSQGDLGRRIDPRPTGDLRAPADAFNDMAQSIERLLEAASQERSRLIAALNSSIDAVLAVDPEGTVTFANSAAEQLFSRPQEELVGNPFVWVMADEQVVEAVRASREEGSPETRLIERPQRRYLQVITTPILGGGEWAALVVFHDLTDVKRVEQVRRDFVANVSHELRTPLAALKSVIETLQSGALEDQAAALDFLARADVEVDRMVQMVEELLELSRIESGDVPLTREEVHLGAIVAHAVERLRPQATRRGLRLSLDLSPDLPLVLGDPDRLERVALNLIQNAITFTPSGGAIDVAALPANGGVAVVVRDTGVGIAREELPRVFERFYKADRARAGGDGLAGGTGLGLAIVKHTVEAHGGHVSAESEQGRGATFRVSIPSASRPSAE
jgi:two-component system phosphate regulon sensor histidine kinase PhoR